MLAEKPLFRAATVFVAVWSLLLSSLSWAEDRPRVGLVLGGGGARGVAHIGVLKVLEEMRIPVSCVSGTSMGALIGGLYAAGVTPDEMVQRLGKIDWDALFTDDPPRVQKPYRAKRDDFEHLFHFELGERGGALLLPPGVTEGYKFEFLLRDLVARTGNHGDQDFDALPIPFRATATNIENGTSQVFRRGDLVKAMRASMSVPGVIAPVEINGVLYTDGGLLQNLPVDTAREMCADVVIAVNVGSGLLPRDKLDSVLNISLQMVSVMMEQNVRASIASLTPSDVLVTPDLSNFSAADFGQALVLIPKGEAATRARAEALAHLSVSPEEYRAWRQAVAARARSVQPVRDVRVATGGKRINPQVIERELAEVPGIDLHRRPETDFSVDNLNTRLEQIYGRGDFERMDYRFIDEPAGRTVEVQGIEKSWGPNFIKFGLGFAADSEQTRFNANLSHRATWINALGAEWRNDFQLGYRKRYISEFYQPLSTSSDMFFAPRLVWDDKPLVYFLDGRRVGEYRVKTARLHGDFGVQNKYGELRLGAFVGRLRAKEDFGVLDVAPNFNLSQAGYTASATYDQIDNPQFGRNGVLATLRTFGTFHTTDPEGNYNKTELFAMGAKTWGRHTLQLAAYHGDVLSGEAKNYDPFFLGGFLWGSGYRMDELLGTSASLVRIVYANRFATLPRPLGSGIYFGGSLEATRASLGVDLEADAKFRPSLSIFVGADTFLGPAYLGWGQGLSDDRPGSLYFMLGSP